MMTKTTSKLAGICRQVAIIPVFFAAICIFSSKSIAQDVPKTIPQQKSGNVESNSTKKEVKTVTAAKSANTNEPVPFALVETKPKFQNGDPQITFKNWVSSQIKYPEAAVKAGVQGHIILQFTVDKTGNVKNVKVMKSVHPDLDAEAVRVIESSPAWTPGKSKNKPVDVSFNFPVNFQLNENSSDLSKNTNTTEQNTDTDETVPVTQVETKLSPRQFITFSLSIPVTQVETKPKFQNGDFTTTFLNWVLGQIKYPETAAKAGAQGKVIVQFTVDAKGNVKDVKVRKSVHPDLDAEAIRVIESSPAWTPGKNKNKPVDVSFDFPVSFQLD
jgi:TonB family protein